MTPVALVGFDAAAAARWRDLLAAQSIPAEIFSDPEAVTGAPEAAALDAAGLDPAALRTAVAGLAARGAETLVLSSLPRGTSYRARREALAALGAADMMEAPGAPGDFVTRMRALLLRRRPPHVLVVEDDCEIGAWAAEIFRGAGMQATLAGSLAEGRAAFEAGRVDALVVDRNLPDGDGLDFVAALRRHGIGAPALLFTARDSLEDRIRGLREAWADDYICKPVYGEELLARVQVLLRPREAGEILAFGPLEINRRDHLIRWRGALAPLRAKEAELLVYLAERADLAIPQRMIFADVWQKLYADPTSKPVAAAKHRLMVNFRAFLAARGEVCPDFVLTEGEAYRFAPQALLRLPGEAGAAGPE